VLACAVSGNRVVGYFEGVTNRLWEVAGLVALWEGYERGEERAA
jgi:hypothetical protein